MSSVKEIFKNHTLDELFEILNVTTKYWHYLNQWFLSSSAISYPAQYTINIEKIRTATYDKYPDIDLMHIPITAFKYNIACKLEQLVFEKFSDCIPNDIHFTTYHEYPDFSHSYTYDEIVNTFNAVSELQQISPHNDIINSKFYLTEKSYCDLGNILDVTVFTSFGAIYIYENPENNQYLLLSKSHAALILMDHKFEF